MAFQICQTVVLAKISQGVSIEAKTLRRKMQQFHLKRIIEHPTTIPRRPKRRAVTGLPEVVMLWQQEMVCPRTGVATAKTAAAETSEVESFIVR